MPTYSSLSPVHTSNNVEATLSNATMSNVASTLSLVWTGPYQRMKLGRQVPSRIIRYGIYLRALKSWRKGKLNVAYGAKKETEETKYNQ